MSKPTLPPNMHGSSVNKKTEDKLLQLNVSVQDEVVLEGSNLFRESQKNLTELDTQNSVLYVERDVVSSESEFYRSVGNQESSSLFLCGQPSQGSMVDLCYSDACYNNYSKNDIVNSQNSHSTMSQPLSTSSVHGELLIEQELPALRDPYESDSSDDNKSSSTTTACNMHSVPPDFCASLLSSGIPINGAVDSSKPLLATARSSVSPDSPNSDYESSDTHDDAESWEAQLVSTQAHRELGASTSTFHLTQTRPEEVNQRSIGIAAYI